MGIDIHTFIEVYGETEQSGKFAYCVAKFKIRRDYDLFSCFNRFKRRGLPEEISGTIRETISLMVVCKEESDSFFADCISQGYMNNNGPGWITQEKAREWVANEGSFYLDDSESWVSEPYWLDPSWLTLAEVEEALELYKATGRENYDFLVLVDLMHSVEKHAPLGDVRLIYWYDA